MRSDSLNKQEVLFVCESHNGIHAEICSLLNWTLSAFTLSYSFSQYEEILSIDEEVSIHVSKPSSFRYIYKGKDESDLYTFGAHLDIADVLYKSFMEMIERDENAVIMLAHDADPAGDLMAGMLRKFLIKRGVDPSRIVRIVAIEIKEKSLYIVEDSFYADAQLLAVLNARREEKLFQGVSPVIQEGYRKAFSVAKIEDVLHRGVGSEEMKNKNPKGFGLSTYLLKYALGEEG